MPAAPGNQLRSKRTPETIAALTQAIAAGLPRRAAASIAGISHETFYSWLDESDETRFCADVRDAVARAEAACQERRLARITKAGEGGTVVKEKTTERKTKDGTVIVTTEREIAPPQWLADAWTLERRFPQEFGRPERQLNLSVDARQQTIFAADSLIAGLLKARAITPSVENGQVASGTITTSSVEAEPSRTPSS